MDHIRRFLLGLVIAGLLGWVLGATAQGVNTFEGNGVIQQLYPVNQQIVIDGQRYVLPTAVVLQATDQRGAKVALRKGMLVSFYGTVSGRTRQIQGISFLRWNYQ
jgi:hypothetical protein